MPALAEKPEKVAHVVPNAPWRETTLGQVVSASTEKVDPLDKPDAPYIGLEHIERDAGTINGQGTAADVKSTKAVFRKGDLLYGKLRPYLNKVWIAQFDGVCSTDILVYTKCDSVDNSFLKYRFMASDFVGFASENSNGVNLPRVNAKALARFPLWLPPLPEQRRIVAEIEQQFTRLDAGAAALHRTQANLKRYRAAVLKAACEGRLVPTEAELARTNGRKYETGEQLLSRILLERRKKWNVRGQYKEPAAPDTRKVATVPEGWTWASVDQLADETMIGLDRGRPQQSSDPSTGVPYIKMNNVTMDGKIHCDELVFVPATREEATRFAVQDGDILFNTRNSKELVGKVGLVRNPPVGAIYNNNLMRIRVPAGMSQSFLALQMCSHEFRQRMELVKKATTSVAAVYSKDLLPLAIALPPLSEQTRIVVEIERRLSVVDELEPVVKANLQRATRLRQSILQQAFTGDINPTELS